MNKETARNTLDVHAAQYKPYSELEEACAEMARKMYAVEYTYLKSHYPHHRGNSGLEFDYITSEGNQITVHMKSWSCGEEDYHEWTFPLDWFDNPLWESEYLQELDRKRLQRIKENEEKEEERKRVAQRARVVVLRGTEKQGKVVGVIANTTSEQQYTAVQWDNETEPELITSESLEYLFPEDREAMRGSIYRNL